jgi:hypothetical protein
MHHCMHMRQTFCSTWTWPWVTLVPARYKKGVRMRDETVLPRIPPSFSSAPPASTTYYSRSAADHHPRSHQHLRTTPISPETISAIHTYIPLRRTLPLTTTLISPPPLRLHLYLRIRLHSHRHRHSAAFTPTFLSHPQTLTPHLRIVAAPSLARLPETPIQSPTTPESHEPCRVPRSLAHSNSPPLRLSTTPHL